VLVLVTGVTGYVGANVADQFLQAGYTVVGTSRKAAKAKAIKEYFSKYGAGKFEIFEAGDLEKEGVFDEAVKDVEAIAHVASPATFTPEDPIRDVINPAINGTISLLQSAHKYGKKVKHIVITSSVASVVGTDVNPDHVYNEEDWNDGAMKAVLEMKANGKPLEGVLAYFASKNEAERVAWKFKKENNPSFTLTTILPTFVYGPILPHPTTEEAVKATSTPPYIINFYTGEFQDPNLLMEPSTFVNVQDVGRAHVLAIEKAEKADGERYILDAGPYSMQQVVDTFREAFPERQNVIAKGTPGNYKRGVTKLDGSKATRDLGIKYSDLQKTVIDTINSVESVY